MQDLEKIDFSEAIKKSGYSILDQSRSDRSDRGVMTRIPGLPVDLSLQDKRAIEEKVLSSSGYNYDKSTKISYVRTALSVVGANMYSECIGARNIRIELPRSAYSERSFLFTVKWAPQYNAPELGDVEVRVINGSIEGRQIYSDKMRRFSSKTLLISKGGGMLQVSVNIDGNSHPILIIPPNMPLKEFDYVRRRGEANEQRSSPGYKCTNTAYLVSERGSVAGDAQKSCRLCVSASASGVVISSTAKVDAALSARGAFAEVEEQSNALEACGRFWTSGAGRGSGRFEVHDGSTFTVWEAVPKQR